MNKLKKILLIDNEISTYVTKALLEDLAITEKIDVVTDGKLGLEYLLKNCYTSGTNALNW